MTKNYYEILGVKSTSTIEEIKISYKKLVKKYHPDINKTPEAEELFKKINEAFGILGDEIKKLKYDTLMGIEPNSKEEKEENTEEKPQDDFSKDEKKQKNDKKSQKFGDFMNKFFEEKEKPLKRIDGENINTTVEITSKEAILGVVKKVNIIHSEKCSKCGGRKFINGATCTMCGGTGEINIHKKVTITIPKNPKQGSIIKVKGEGKFGKYGGKSGDLILKIKIIQKNVFKLDTGIATLEVPITPWEAFLGADVLIPTMAGNATIKIPPQTNSHDKFKISNGGILNTKTGKRGELVVIIKICVPQKPTIEEIRAYKEIKRLDESNVREELFE